MYEELIQALREHADKMCVTFKGAHACGSNLALEAADAIEGLSRVAEAIQHRCECCVGCELEKKNGGCDHAFVLSPKRAMQYLSKHRWIPVKEEQDGKI